MKILAYAWGFAGAIELIGAIIYCVIAPADAPIVLIAATGLMFAMGCWTISAYMFRTVERDLDDDKTDISALKAAALEAHRAARADDQPLPPEVLAAMARRGPPQDPADDQPA